MNFSGKQIIAIIIAVLSVMGSATGQLTDLFGPTVAKDIASFAGLVTAALSSALAVITTQTATVKDVLAMPGIDNIAVNAQANSALAAIAVDPDQDKISPTPSAQQAVEQTAKGV